ncbi:kinase-like protein [Mytilinidion resinicola]|uniref:EKC/KEOPS complex subunit BUD32 n=1 Tax=Mytilinidion resinicola TaxID=574789 RepID=A0A6A6Y9A6_9PEZI|nr:kinase-like protein [Mytilinidion resinicola]KAF2805396.1 kinase-like protein [Mytilinidion resinicola]
MQESVIQWPLGLDIKDLVGAGVTAIVARLDAVVKFFGPSELHFFEREKLIYQRLGRDHNGIVRYFGILENAIILQFASQTSIRQYVARQKHVPLSLRLRWVEQLFDAVRFIHSRSVLHGDISCNNVFLDDNLDVKLGDFAGSAIDDLPPPLSHHTTHQLPAEDTPNRNESFAPEQTSYNKKTSAKPKKELNNHQKSPTYHQTPYPNRQAGTLTTNKSTRS